MRQQFRRVPRDHREPPAVRRRRRRVVAATAVTGAAFLGASLSTPPASRRFYVLTAATAATWATGSLLSGPLHLGHAFGRGDRLSRPLLGPVLLGAAAFVPFYGAALVCRRVPPLRRLLTTVLSYARQGDGRAVLATTLVNGAAEELFFRGALYAAIERSPVAASTGTYMLATTATRNPMLVAASSVMGALFGLQRDASGGIQAPMITHLVWSSLMLRFLPRLFPPA